MTDGSITKTDIERALSLGAKAKLRLYQTFLTRIAQGERLTATELKNMRALETELEESTNGGEKKEQPVIMSMDDAAAYCGISKRTVSYHLKRGNIAQNADGTFDKAVLDAWLEKYGRKKKAEQGGGKRVSLSIEEKLDRAKLRKEVAAAKRNEILVAELQGRLAPWSEIERAWCERVAVVAAGLDSLAERLPPLLTGKKPDEMREIIRRETNELRRAYARRGKYCPTDA
ncbi:hypothetical protein [Desulfatitalea tepidiphila]|uniref:hypothetical protein n=1 Tax=Desulfatitalea tepidiphila TaxID=1185843 RepID=UPI0006B51883|nr:hypothetical protein [Desulfatitalea tepidiphila]